MCFGMGCEYEDRYSGECKYRGFGYPCTDWPDEEQEESCPDEGEEE